MYNPLGVSVVIYMYVYGEEYYSIALIGVDLDILHQCYVEVCVSKYRSDSSNVWFDVTISDVLGVSTPREMVLWAKPLNKSTVTSSNFLADLTSSTPDDSYSISAHDVFYYQIFTQTLDPSTVHLDSYY